MSIIVEENVLHEDAVVFDEEFQQNYVPKVQSFSKGMYPLLVYELACFLSALWMSGVQQLVNPIIIKKL